VSSVESNEMTAATVSCDLAPPPQRRRRRHPPPPHHVTFLSLHYGQHQRNRLHPETNMQPQIINTHTHTLHWTRSFRGLMFCCCFMFYFLVFSVRPMISTFIEILLSVLGKIIFEMISNQNQNHESLIDLKP